MENDTGRKMLHDPGEWARGEAVVGEVGRGSGETRGEALVMCYVGATPTTTCTARTPTGTHAHALNPGQGQGQCGDG